MSKTESDIVTKTDEEIKEPSTFNVVIHNNDLTSYEEVIIILTQAFELSHANALQVAHTVNSEGKGLCGNYSKEIAETKIMLVNMIKNQLILMMPERAMPIKILKFTVEKA